MNSPLKDSNTKNNVEFVVPETPCLKKIGYGTGVGVYHYERSPALLGRSPKSPWALKKVLGIKEEFSSYGKLLNKEASLLRKLDHPNIIGFRAFVRTPDGREVLAMEECTACLGDLVEQRYEQQLDSFSAKNILNVCFDVAKALNYLHNEAKLMHGDIKSHNILIKGDFDIVKLCDFGVALKVDENECALDKYIGTNSWSSPEVFEGSKVTVKADIFSYGLVIYEMIALKMPHDNYDEFSDSNIFDDSQCSMERSSFFSEDNFGKRPTMPNKEFGEDYKKIFQIYYICTEQEAEKRPSAQYLIDELKNHQLIM